ncbi:hypothetical protein GOV08_05010 [Candidatus Woesearchaeota archaeon]|nr:hypothetical protein [Candidatus Woesearchaeota archaeon]
MGLFDFLKKREVKVKEESVSFNKLEDWIKNKSLENKEIENNILKDVKKRIILFTNDLDSNIEVLKNIDIDEKKDDNRTKSIVKTALKSYISQLERLNLSGDITEINNSLSEFEQKSFKAYEKVTYLIGKEMAAVKTTFQNLYKFLKTTEEENKELFEANKAITSIKQKLEAVKEIGKDLENLKVQENELENELKELKTNEKQTIEQIQNIKNSREHLNNLKKIEEKTKDENTLKQLISELRLLIDFKKLTSIFHSSENFMSKIKRYKEKFSDAIEEQNTLLDMLDESNLNNEKIKTKFKQINETKEKIESAQIQEDKTKQLEPKLKNIQERINKINPKDNKKRVKIIERKDDVITSIKQELKKINTKLTK